MATRFDRKAYDAYCAQNKLNPKDPKSRKAYLESFKASESDEGEKKRKRRPITLVCLGTRQIDGKSAEVFFRSIRSDMYQRQNDAKELEWLAICDGYDTARTLLVTEQVSTEDNDALAGGCTTVQTLEELLASETEGV